MTRLASLSAVLFAIATAVLADERVRYEIRFENADHHEAEVTATFPGVEGPLEVRMSRSSPGRYALHEFAKNVYGVRATDGAGRALDVTRPDPYQWRVAGHDGTVVFRYTVFGDRCDGTYLAVDNTHAHLNMPATFVWARGLESRAIELAVFPAKPEFTVATQLAPTGEANVFTAPGLDYFLDSPTEIGPVQWYSWKASSDGEAATIRIALHHLGTEAQARAYARLAEAVVAEQIAIFGDLPDFDHGSYTFDGELPDFERLLALAGLELRRPGAARAWLGASLSASSEGGRISTRPFRGSPLYEAGADLDDVVTRIGETAIGSDTDVDALLAIHAPGDRVSIRFEKRGESREAEIALQGDPEIEVVPFEHAGRAVGDSMLEFRKSWLSSRSSTGAAARRACGECRRSFALEMEFCPYDGSELRVEAEERP